MSLTKPPPGHIPDLSQVASPSPTDDAAQQLAEIVAIETPYGRIYGPRWSLMPFALLSADVAALRKEVRMLAGHTRGVAPAEATGEPPPQFLNRQARRRAVALASSTANPANGRGRV